MRKAITQLLWPIALFVIGGALAVVLMVLVFGREG